MFCAETSVSNCQPQKRAGLNWQLVPLLLAFTVSKIYSQQQGQVAALQAAGLAPVLPTE
jgi:hypothetical protein